MSCKRMPKSVGRDALCDAGFFYKVFNDEEDHYPGQTFASAVKKQDVFFTILNRLMYAYRFPVNIDIFCCTASNRHQPFFISFTNYSYKANIQVQLR